MQSSKLIKRHLAISLVIFMMVPSFAQELYIDLSNTTGTADFLFGSKLVENASYTTSGLTFSSVLSDNSRAYLDLSHSQIYPFAEYSSSQGELGLQLRYLKIEDNQLFAGLYAYLNRYQDDYSYYDRSGFGLYGKWKYYFQASQLITVGYDLNFKKYAEVAEASNTEHEFHISYNQSFKTKTSFNLESAVAVQDFWPQTSLSGRGRHISVIEVNDIPSNTLVSTKLRVSQSLGQKTGLTLWLSSQTLLNDNADPLSLQDGLDNPFTDRFRWEGPSTSLRLVYQLNSNNSVLLSHSYTNKSYLDVPVYQFDFEQMEYSLVDDELVSLGIDRDDERSKIQIQWTRNWSLTRYTWLSGIDVILGTGLTQNRSNDPLYDYTSMDYSIGLNFNN